MIHVRYQGPFRLIENVLHTAIAALRIRERRVGEVEFSASVDGRRMAETALAGSGRSPTSAVGAEGAETPTPSEEQPQ